MNENKEISNVIFKYTNNTHIGQALIHSVWNFNQKYAIKIMQLLFDAARSTGGISKADCIEAILMAVDKGSDKIVEFFLKMFVQKQCCSGIFVLRIFTKTWRRKITG